MFKYLLPGNSKERKFQYCESIDKDVIKAKGYVAVSEEDALDLLRHNKRWNDNAQLVKYTPSSKDKKQKLNNEIFARNLARESKIIGLQEWFKLYDIQVNEYNRAIRLGEEPNIHIGDKTFATIAELDAEAKKHSEQIKAYKAEMEPYEK